MFKEIKKQKGQGLLELIIAIGVITVGLFAVWNLFLSNFSGEEEARARIIGVNLAREGVEAVKNIRDSNWLKVEENEEGAEWDSGLSGDGTAVVSDLFTENLRLDFAPNNINGDAAKLFINSDGFFDSDSGGQPTAYRRLITLSDICCADNEGGLSDLKCDDNIFTETESGIPCASGLLKIGIKVKSEVAWQVNGKPRNITAEDDLFNWK
ncbi:MAG: hypothetical protein AAB358_01220 [Patescibacteria group bacterium]